MRAAHTLNEILDLGIGAFVHGVIACLLDRLEELAGILQIEKFPGGKLTHSKPTSFNKI